MEYPQRPKLFVLRVIDQMVAARLANSAGTDVFALLAVIARVEDKLGYTRPAEFFNEQLASEAGLKSVKQLDRVRSRAVREGWLTYSPGGKSRAGKYFVNDMSGRVLPLTDADERRGNGEATGETTAKERRDNGTATARKRGRQRRGNGEATGEHSSLFPVLDPNPIPIPSPSSESSSLRSEDSCEHSPGERTKGPKPAGEEAKPRPRNDLFDAVAEVCGADPRLNGSQVGKAAADLAKAGYTPADVRAFAARLVEFCPWAKDRPHRRPEVGELVKHIGKIRTAGRPVTAAPVPPEQQPGFDPKLGFVPTPGFKYRNPLTED